MKLCYHSKCGQEVSKAQGSKKVSIKKGDVAIVYTPSRDRWTLERFDCVIVTTVFKTGNIKVCDTTPSGSTLDSSFFKMGGTITKVDESIAQELKELFAALIKAYRNHADNFFDIRRELRSLDPTRK